MSSLHTSEVDPIEDFLIYHGISAHEIAHQRRRIARLKKERKTNIESTIVICQRFFYFVIFYSILALVFVGYLNWYMYFQVPRDHPALTGMHSSLQMNPGLSHVVNLNIFNSLLRFRPREPLHYARYSDAMVSFLHAYQDNTGSFEYEDCVQEGGINQSPTRPCTYDVNAAGPCNIMNGYGIETGQPCFAFKIGRIYGWLPDIVEYATGVLMKCEGASDDDTYNLGTIRYYDMDYKFSAIAPAKNPGKITNGSFHSMYFPYQNQNSYLQPLIFVLFDGIQRNVLIRVRCYLIAKNIKVDFETGEGSTQFEIIYD